jgi:endonuclease/exonuclease/phosphatase family metal-dependent hydrolase
MVAAGALLLSGCATFPPDRMARCTTVPARIAFDPQSGEASTEISVLTYNVEGLPWPARRSRGPQLQEIGRRLADMRSNGQAPDIVLLQEVFTTEAGRLTESSGYASRIRGPGRSSRRPPTSNSADPALVGRRKILKGERLVRLFSSGLYILTDFAVLDATGQPFRRRECAGFDCLANKGLQHVRVQLPGVPQPVELFNMHLNSGASSRVRPERSLIAHRLQIEDTARFIQQQRNPDYPLIYGGDLNMRHNDARFLHFSEVVPYTLVHEYCALLSPDCDVRLSWDGDLPWMDTQDLQGFGSGSVVTVRPVRVEGLFDQPWRGAPLADHDGFLVVYRLSWPASATPAADAVPLCPAGTQRLSAGAPVVSDRAS